MSMVDSVNHLQQLMIEGGQRSFDLVPKILKKVIDKRLWAEKIDKDGKPFKSFEQFVIHRLPQGLESDMNELIAYCRRYPDVQELIKEAVDPAGKKGGDRKSRSRTNQTDSISLKSSSKYGTSPPYIASRVKKEDPKLLEEVKQGKYKSIRQAAIAKGIVKSRQLWMPTDPKKAIEKIHRLFGEEFVSALIEEGSKYR